MKKLATAKLKQVPVVMTEIEYTDPENWMTIAQVVSSMRKSMLSKMKLYLHEKVAMLTEEDLEITLK